MHQILVSGIGQLVHDHHLIERCLYAKPSMAGVFMCSDTRTPASDADHCFAGFRCEGNLHTRQIWGGDDFSDNYRQAHAQQSACLEG